ncbi:uncharacterized protein LOC122714895 isoform X2 [Apis laboriosa]|uniref:uncharacterized protein LOC122714895 isoform X2 n=1 Tax=Apis laboriosa TaxID=183418 RepID=UPI001CC43A56|nr:uncharacterized protein LOC122714895 isoform X2 [Apis laboriosa]
MGNNGSSSRDQQVGSVCSNGVAVDGTNGHHGWSQSFPRELTRHKSQPSAARKVLPEPPGQRLRATDNGSIIHNGGTISGRRPPTFASSRDLAKRNDHPPPSFRERSGSASNLVRPCSRRIDRHYYRSSRDHPNDTSATTLDPKKFGSEPDLRSAPMDLVHPEPPATMLERDAVEAESSRHRHHHHHYHGKDSRERLVESGCSKARKKYKAPAPPASPRLRANSSPPTETSRPPSRNLDPRLCTPYSRTEHQSPNDQQSNRSKVEPPPRRSRLFKTRAESKRAQIGWQLLPADTRDPTSINLGGSRSDNELATEASVESDRRRIPPRCSRLSEHHHGKGNTLQRSISNPEFQAELIRVAKKVRDKLDSSGLKLTDGSIRDTRYDRKLPASRPSGNNRRKQVERGKENREGGEEGCAQEPRSRDHFARHEMESQRDQFRDENSDSDGSKLATVDRSRERTGNSVSNERSATGGEIQDEAFAPITAQPATPKTTFYFGMNERFPDEFRNDEDRDAIATREFHAVGVFKHSDRDRDRGDGRTSMDEILDDADEDNEKNVVENISLKLRPTLPKKQLEIPRFSPSAAWRLLSTLETPGPSMSTASEEMPVMFEERIERLSRPPPLFPLSLGARSWHDKSGDSGISGDAGAANEDSFDVSTINRAKTTVTRPTWTPQQDLGEESSSDAGVDSPPPLSTPMKYRSPRGHVFSLSLPRDEARASMCLCPPETKTRDAFAFNSLQKLKRSVSGAFGIGSHDHTTHRKYNNTLDDNWLLSTSAPTSLQHPRLRLDTAPPISPTVCHPFSHRRVPAACPCDSENDDNDGDDDDDEDDVEDDDDDDEDEDEDEEDDRDDDHDDDHDDDENVARDRESSKKRRDDEDKTKENDFPVIMKPPSFSYLTPGGHVMYLPETNETEHRVQNLNGRKIGEEGNVTRRKLNNGESIEREIASFRLNSCKNVGRSKGDKEDGSERKERSEEAKRRKEKRRDEIEDASNRRRDDKSLKNHRMDENGCRERNEFSTCPEPPKQRRTFSPPSTNDHPSSQIPWMCDANETKSQRKSNSRGKRFTFQSTVRQIERRRLAEKLSREAEAKERQRKGELEAMRKVEEEFQRKRAKEKASIRQQLRLFKEMEENFNLPTPPDWDGSQLSRADPDGAPSSTASSPISLPNGNPPMITSTVGKRGDTEPAKQPRSDSKGYRPKYYDWPPDSANHSDHKQTTVHPKIVCDIPKSSPVFVHANLHPGKPPVVSNSTPKSDNYRKDFAHGTMVTRTSFASSDSELSQPNTRPHSRENGIKIKSHRPRSTSPARSADIATSKEDLSQLIEPTEHPKNPTAHQLTSISGLQPFTKRKTYRPIFYNPCPTPPIPS